MSSRRRALGFTTNTCWGLTSPDKELLSVDLPLRDSWVAFPSTKNRAKRPNSDTPRSACPDHLSLPIARIDCLEPRNQQVKSGYLQQVRHRSLREVSAHNCDRSKLQMRSNARKINTNTYAQEHVGTGTLVPRIARKRGRRSFPKDL